MILSLMLVRNIYTKMQKLIIAISGASGAIYGITALKAAKALGVETHLIVSKAAGLALHEETGLSLNAVHDLADHVYKPADIGARLASGSFKTMGMLIAPCSIKTLSEIATGVTSSLMSRAADVTLKERRRLVLMVRESPLHLGHLRSMASVSEMGAIIAPPVPSFYTRPQNLQDMVDQTMGRALDLFGLEGEIKRWDGLSE